MAIDALQIVYDGVGSFENAYLHSNLTSSRPGKVVKKGKLPPVVPAVLFVIWAAGSIILAIGFGFGRRWSSSLGGYSLFRLGADLAEEIRDQVDFLSVQGFEKCEKLWRLPGFAGDSRVRMDIGYISLIEKGVINKGKLYN